MDNFLDTPIPEGQVFSNAPACRTRREATRYYLEHTPFLEPQPPGDEPDEILHQIAHPFSMGSVIDRQIALQKNGTVRKSVRAGRSNLDSERHNLQLIAMKTSFPVPKIHQYYKSAEFEHLIMDNIPGTTLERVWPTLSYLERESMADQVVSFIQELRKLCSSSIEAALLFRKPLRRGLHNATEFNQDRIKSYLHNECIMTYVDKRSALIDTPLNVFTHGDLDWSNILIVNKQVCGIIDLESSGFFPPYWEWMMTKKLSQGFPQGSWFHLLEKRLGKEAKPSWQGMWEVEQLIMALDQFSHWALTPEGRALNRKRGWAKVVDILGAGVGNPPPVTYTMASEHPWWIVLASGKVKEIARRLGF